MTDLGNQLSSLGTPTHLLPFARITDAGVSSTREALELSIEPATLSRLSSAAPNVESTLLAVWQTLLWRFTDKSEIVVGWIGLIQTQAQPGTATKPFREV